MYIKDLDAQFLKIGADNSLIYVYNIEDAQGIVFLCPKCYLANNGAIGTHSIICWFMGRGVPEELNRESRRWVLEGSSYDNITFGDAGIFSECCKWHGHVENGIAVSI